MEASITNTTKVHAFSKEHLEKVADWLKGFGINYNSTRFGISSKIYADWFVNGQVPSFQELWGITELLDLCELHNSFFNSHEIQKSFMKRIARGTNFLEDDNKNSARDFFFEVKVASRFKRAGFDVEIDGEHDIIAKNNIIELGIECKRPRSENAIVELVEYAYEKQLNKLDDRSSKGIICLDVSRILYGEYIEALNNGDFKTPVTTPEYLASYRDKTDTRFKDLLFEKCPEVLKGIRMFIIYYSSPLFVEDEEDETRLNFRKFSHFSHMSLRKDEVTTMIAKALTSSVGMQVEN